MRRSPRRGAPTVPGIAAEPSPLPRPAPSVVLADENAFFRTGLAHGLRAAGLVIAAEAGTGPQVVDVAALMQPDVVATVLDLPGFDGVEATRRLAAAVPGCRVVVLAEEIEDAAVVDAILAGAAGFLRKDVPVGEIADAIRAAAVGGLPLVPAAVRAVVAGLRRTAGGGNGHRPRLTDRELDVLALLADGCGNTEIAEQLLISPHTVKSHVSSLLEKLGVSNRVQAVVRAHRDGFLAIGAVDRARRPLPPLG